MSDQENDRRRNKPNGEYYWKPGNIRASLRKMLEFGPVWDGDGEALREVPSEQRKVRHCRES